MASFFELSGIKVYNGNALDFYNNWESPTIIMSDGPYGVNGYPGDLHKPDTLDKWYEPHIKQWSQIATPITTLWFWNTEVGWATVHPMLVKHGWKYVSCCVWNKGMGHAAGNTNTKTIRHLPVVTEICAQYVKEPTFNDGMKTISMKQWLRNEWQRSGLPFAKTNEACGVKNAASRKYFTNCHLWYMPPADAFEKIANYANLYGHPDGRPYFSINNSSPLTKEEWEKLRAIFHCPIGITNVWDYPQLMGKERIKIKSKAVHLNQKPLELIQRLISMSSNESDIIWDPFGGLCTTSIAAMALNRKCYSSEINPEVFKAGTDRITNSFNEARQYLF